MTSIAPDELPSEVLALALSDAAPLTSLEPKARRLSMLAENHSCSGGWVAVEEILGDRPGVAKRLRQAGLTGGAVNYDPAFGSALIAVGRTKRFDNPRPAWFAVVGGDVLRHQGRPVLFRTSAHAQRAALLADAALHLRRVTSLMPDVLTALAELHNLSDQHDPRIPAPSLTPRMHAYLCAKESDGNPLREFDLAMLPLFGAWVRGEEESRPNRLSITISVAWPQTLAPMGGIACDLINKALARLDEVFDSDYQAAIKAEWGALFREIGAG